MSLALRLCRRHFRANRLDRRPGSSNLAASSLRVVALTLLALGGDGPLGTASVAQGWSTFAVDDSTSQTQARTAQLRWRHALPSRDDGNLLEAAMDVRIVLNVTPWVGKPARVYMVMPALLQSNLAIQWTSSGLLLPGRLASGQRQLVFQGVVPGPRIEDTMRVTVLADARDPVTPQRVNFTFEIEVPGR